MDSWSKIQEKVYSKVNEATRNIELNTPKIRILKMRFKNYQTIIKGS